MQRIWFFAPALLALSACGGGGTGGSATSAQPAALQGTIQLSEREFSIKPRKITVSKTGAYAFRVTNDGQIGHALEIEGKGVEKKTDTIDPGSSATLRVDLPSEGTYEVYCPIDGHRSKGMTATLTVGSAAMGGPGTGPGSTTTQTQPGY